MQIINLTPKNPLTDHVALRENLHQTLDKINPKDISHLLMFEAKDYSRIETYSITMIDPDDDINPDWEETHNIILRGFISILLTQFPDQIPQEIPDHLLIIHGEESLAIHLNDQSINLLYHCTAQW